MLIGALGLQIMLNKQPYGGDQDLDKTDRFLRDFILKEGWLPPADQLENK
jgi:hypothetical protein